MTRQLFITILFTIFIVQQAIALEYNIIHYGAIADTTILSTQAIQKAIDECTSNGGGQVTIPSGSYKTGTIILKSNVGIYLEPGAILYGSKNLNDYIPLKPAYVSFRTQESTVQLIYAENAINISISGYGEINGQGSSFKKLSWNDEGITRPHLIRFITCRQVTIENITLKNSGCWMQHYLACEMLQIRGIKIFNRNNYNNDGLDIDGCRNVTISDIITDSDDDGITLKSTSPRPCENITITNCVISSRCNAIKMGTESNGGFKNICISNCIVKPSEISATAFYGEEKGISGLSLEIVDGGIMEGITISNIQIDGTQTPIFIRLGNRARPYKKDLSVDKVGSLGDVSISNINIKNAGKTGCSITGQPGFPVNNIRLSHISISFIGGGTLEDGNKSVDEKPKEYPEGTMFGILPSFGFYIRHATGISFNEIKFMTEKQDFRPSFYMEDVKQSKFTDMQVQSHSEASSDFRLKDCKDVVIEATALNNSKSCTAQLDGDKNFNIQLNSNHCKPGQ